MLVIVRRGWCSWGGVGGGEGDPNTCELYLYGYSCTSSALPYRHTSAYGYRTRANTCPALVEKWYLSILVWWLGEPSEK